VVGIIHSSGISTNAGMPRYAIRHLVDSLGVDPSSIRIGLTPGVSSDNFFLTEEDNAVSIDEEGKINDQWALRKNIVDRNWKHHIEKRNMVQGPYQKRHVDITKATIMQFLEEGILPENIQAYDVDSYKAAEKGESYSNRYTSEHSGKRPGRFILAVQLKPSF
jgi:copper oxidase (laccase) domain-containing protein